VRWRRRSVPVIRLDASADLPDNVAFRRQARLRSTQEYLNINNQIEKVSMLSEFFTFCCLTGYRNGIRCLVASAREIRPKLRHFLSVNLTNVSRMQGKGAASIL
jgi:hypothetical protein